MNDRFREISRHLLISGNTFRNSIVPLQHEMVHPFFLSFNRTGKVLPVGDISIFSVEL